MRSATAPVDEKKPWIVSRQAEVGEFFGVSTGTVRAWNLDGMPGRPGAYDLSAINRWYLARPRLRAKDQAATTPAAAPTLAQDEPKPAGSANLEALRGENAKIQRLKRLQMEGSLIPRDVVHTILGRIAIVYRSASEQIQRRFGRDAGLLIDEHLEQADSIVAELATARPDEHVDHA